MRGQPATQGSRYGLGWLRNWLFVTIFLAGNALIHAQESGTVVGIVVNTWNGTPLPGVVITVRGTTLAAQTDENGRYQLKNVPPGDQVLRFSKAGFAAAVVTDVRVLAGQSTTVNGNLRPEFYEMEEYEVTAEEFGSQTEKILFERQQAGNLMEAIGSEQFSRLGAGDAGAIVSRVTGVSITDGKYAVVRGLSDRYTRTLLNGVEVPSADPYRTSPQLDLFPSAMIDRVSVSKTFSPDQPGASGGGVIDIVTKSFPEKPFVKGSVGTSYNPDSNLKNNFLAAPKSSVAMIALPTAPAPLDPELFLLTENIDKPPNAVRRGETPQRANDRRAQANEVSGLLQSLGTADFAGVEKKSPLNSSGNASAGSTISLFGNPLGMFAGVNYSRSFQLLSDYERADYGGLLNLQKRGHETKSNIKTDYGANVNLGYKLSDDLEIGFNFMLAHSVDEEARHTTFDEIVEGRAGDTLEKWQLHYTDREIQNYQFRGRLELPFLESKFDWTVSFATTTQDEPNHRFMNYFLSPDGIPTFGDSGLPVPHDPSRYYRTVNEQGLNVRADYTLPLGFMKEDSKFKMGVLSSLVDRDFKEQYFGYIDSAGFDPANPNSYLNNPALLDYLATYRPDIAANATNFSWARFVGFVIGRPYTAYQNIFAGYPMLDLGVFPWLRLIGGVRLERTLLQIHSRDAGSSRIDQLDLLHAASAVVTVITNLNLRLGYGETVARPSFREMAPISNYLPDEDLFADGNPNLKITSITSYDARLEWFPAPGDILSAGVFYKTLKNPIELFNVDIVDSVTWINRDEATVKGVEFEARKSLGFVTEYLKGLTLGANVALIKSETKFTDNEFINKTNVNFQIGKTRPLYAQSPYIINLDLSYDHPGFGTSFTLAANMTGERIILTKAQGADIYEHPPITLDALISQRIFKNWTVRVGVRNILDPEYRQTFGENFDDPVRRSYKRGRTYTLAINAEF